MRPHYRTVGLLSAFGVLIVAPACRTPDARDQTTAKEDAPAVIEDVEADRVYDSVLSALAAKHADAKLQTWEETTGNLQGDWILQSPDESAWDVAQTALPFGTPCTGGADCDGDFKLKLCDTSSACANGDACKPVLASVKKPGDSPLNMCVGLGDFIYDRLYATIISAQKSVDIVSLSPPNGRYRTAIVNALVYLDNAGQKPDVRMLYAGEDSTMPTLRRPVTYLGGWLTELKARKSDFGLTISCAWLSHLASWNHAKIVAADGVHAIVGGMNFWEDVYLSPDPTFDMSLSISGPAALAATRFADTLWNLRPISVGTLPAGKLPVMKHAALAVASTSPSPGTTKVIGAGRLGGFGDDAADTAIDAFIASAKTSIRISQQDIYSILSRSNPFGHDALVDAVLRGVDVYLVKSSVVSTFGYGMYSTTDSFNYLARAIEKKAGKFDSRRPKGTYYRPICEKLHFAPLRYSSANLPDGQVKSHNKWIMVDDAAFYLGSQNMYFANLQEYGYFVFDSALSAQMLAAYWNPAWKHSSASMIPCNPVD